jgi:hypothetical protein
MPCPKVKGRRNRVSPAMPEQVLNGGPDADNLRASKDGACAQAADSGYPVGPVGRSCGRDRPGPAKAAAVETIVYGCDFLLVLSTGGYAQTDETAN